MGDLHKRFCILKFPIYYYYYLYSQHNKCHTSNEIITNLLLSLIDKENIYLRLSCFLHFFICKR